MVGVVVLLRMLSPLCFLLLISGAYGILNNKRISVSLAPAIFWQIIIVFFTSMVFGRLTVGIVVGAFVSVGIIVGSIIKTKSTVAIKKFYWPSFENAELVIFLIIYIWIYIANYGKVYHHWDEFSHWGIFVKEMFRTDMLYCTSQAHMAHKDYVPAISIFETIWCKWSMRYKMEDTYRAIQTFEAALMFPLLMVKNDTKDKTTKDVLISLLLRAIIIFGIPMFIDSYYTLLPDYALGLLVYYSIFVIISSEKIRDIFLPLFPALIVLILTKMTAVVFIPMVVVFFFVYELKFSREQNKGALLIQTCSMLLFPFISWWSYNNYVHRYVTGGLQSYSSLSLAKIIDVLLFKNMDDVGRIVTKSYFSALFKEETFKHIAFLPFVLIIILAIVFVLIQQKDKESKRKVQLELLWVILSAFAYVFFMYFMYMLMFVEREATKLAGYYRYMSTYLVVISYVTVGLFVLYTNYRDNILAVIVSCVIFENGLLFFGFKDYLPNTKGVYIEYENEAYTIVQNVDVYEKVFLLVCGDSGLIYHKINYQCVPVDISWGSVGRPRNEGDVWSKDYSVEDFVEAMKEYDYLYMLKFDEIFLDEYYDAFENPECIQWYGFFRISVRNGKIVLEDKL